jgi:polysaccharide export outer membrane protein
MKTDGPRPALEGNRLMRYLALCLIPLALATPALSAPSSEASSRSETAPAASYLFAAGDVIDITVSSHTGYDRTLTIQPDGRIQVPLVGEVTAAGLTATQLAARIQQGLNAELVDPMVTVSLKSLNQQPAGRVSVLGAVQRSGSYEIKEGATLADALAAAGGSTPQSDLTRVTITRTDQSVTTVDLSKTEKTGRLEQNVPLRSGDIIIVPEGARPAVTVLGEVAKPGTYEIPGQARLLDVLMQAGGPTPKADLRQVTLARPGAAGTRRLDLQPLLVQGDANNPELNIRLQPGDTITIPETDQRVYVLGRVSRPDIYPIKPDERVLDALMKAGGAAADGDLTKAVLVRRDEKGQPVARTLDVKKMMAKGNLAENELLRPGDLLFVPDKKAPRSGSILSTILFPLAGVLNFLR